MDLPTTAPSSGPRVLVTGATGFVGRRLVSDLQTVGARVCCLVRRHEQATELAARGVEGLLGDLTRPETLEGLGGFDVVFHLAGVLAARRANEFERVNVEGCRHLYEALLAAPRAPRRIVHVSSIAAGGPATSPVPRREEDPEAPVSLYGRTKLGGERVARSFGDRLPILILRPAVVYGPRDRNLLPIFKMAARGLVLTPPEQPKQFSLVHVRDLARAMIHAASIDGLVGGPYHVATGKPCSWDELVTEISKALGRRSRQIRLGRWPYRLAAWFHDVESRLFRRRRVDLLIPQKLPELFARFWQVDTRKFWHAMGRVPLTPTPLSAGLRETAGWYQARGWLKEVRS